MSTSTTTTGQTFEQESEFWAGRLDTQVRVTAEVENDSIGRRYAGKIGTLRQVDRRDPRATYYVSFDPTVTAEVEETGGYYHGRERMLWVHAIADPAEPTETEPTEADAAPVDEKDAEIERLRTSLAVMESQRDRARGDRRSAVQELEDLRKAVGRKAKEMANEHGWCEVVKRAVEDLDCEWPEDRVSFDVLVRVRVTATACHTERVDDASFIQNSLTVDGGAVDLDSDWEDVTVEDYEIDDVENIELVED